MNYGMYVYESAIPEDARRFRLFCLISPVLTLLIVVFCFTTACEQSRGSIGGTVLDTDGSPLAGAVIRAEKGGYPAVLLKTHEDGSYIINNIFTGKWVVEFYDMSGRQVGLESVLVKTNETVTLDFTVGEKPPPEHPKIIINQ